MCLNCFRARVILWWTCPLSPGSALLRRACAWFLLTDLLGACSWSTLFLIGPLVQSPECQPSLWSGAGRGRAASSFWASSIAVGEPPVCSLSPWTLFSFSSRSRGSAAHLFSYTWLPGVQGDLGQSGNAHFKLPSGGHMSLLASLCSVSAAFDSCSAGLQVRGKDPHTSVSAKSPPCTPTCPKAQQFWFKVGR